MHAHFNSHQALFMNSGKHLPFKICCPNTPQGSTVRCLFFFFLRPLCLSEFFIYELGLSCLGALFVSVQPFVLSTTLQRLRGHHETHTRELAPDPLTPDRVKPARAGAGSQQVLHDHPFLHRGLLGAKQRGSLPSRPPTPGRCRAPAEPGVLSRCAKRAQVPRERGVEEEEEARGSRRGARPRRRGPQGANSARGARASAPALRPRLSRLHARAPAAALRAPPSPAPRHRPALTTRLSRLPMVPAPARSHTPNRTKRQEQPSWARHRHPCRRRRTYAGPPRPKSGAAPTDGLGVPRSAPCRRGGLLHALPRAFRSTPAPREL